MSSYIFSVSNTLSGSNGTAFTPQIYSLSPGTSEIRITQLRYGVVGVSATDTTFAPHTGFAPTLNRNTGSVASGGTAVTPTALRAGAAASSTSARWGTGVTISGTQTYVYSPIPLTATNTSNQSTTYEFPSDLVVSPGGVLSFTTGNMGTGGSSGSTITATIQVIFFFEELRLAWHN